MTPSPHVADNGVHYGERRDIDEDTVEELVQAGPPAGNQSLWCDKEIGGTVHRIELRHWGFNQGRMAGMVSVMHPESKCVACHVSLLRPAGQRLNWFHILQALQRRGYG